jgi:hypothetical protein
MARGPLERLRDGRAPRKNDGAELLGAIRDILQAMPFHGEGYRKVRARLAHRGLAVSGKRGLRLMRQHQLLAPRRLGPPNGDPAHSGTIIARTNTAITPRELIPGASVSEMPESLSTIRAPDTR